MWMPEGKDYGDPFKKCPLQTMIITFLDPQTKLWVFPTFYISPFLEKKI